MHVFIHTQTGGVKVNDPESTTLKVVMEQAAQVNQPITEKSASKRMITQCIYGPMVPQQVMCELIGGGVPERYPDLHFALIEFNAHWLGSLVGAMDKCWVTGIGQDPDWWLGYWDDTRPASDQPQHGAALPSEREVAVPADAERVRAAPVPRVVPGRSGRGRLPARHRFVDASCGATTTRTPKERSAAVAS